MPQRIKNRSAAQRSRTGTHRRKNRKAHGRQGCERTEQKSSGIIAHSLFALTLHQKPALEVENKINKRAGDATEDYHAMYRDLLAAYQNGMRLSGTPTEADPFKSGLDIGASLSYVISGFNNNLLPGGFEMRIEKDGTSYKQLHYYFSVYIACDFPECWHVFEIMPVVEYLRKYNVKLHDTFIRFIAYMKVRLGINTWYDGALGYADYQMEERIDPECWENNEGFMELEEDANDEAKKDAEESRLRYEAGVDDFNSYNAGYIKEYEQVIKSSLLTADQLNKELAKYNSKNPLVAFMHKMMEFMKEPGSFHGYHYAELYDENEYESVAIDRQVSILWDWDDEYAALECDALDVDASNYGVTPPVFHYAISKHTKQLPLDRFHEWQTWPMRFSKLWEDYRDLTVDYRTRLKIKKRK